MTDNAIYNILKNAETKARNMAEKLGINEKLKKTIRGISPQFLKISNT